MKRPPIIFVWSNGKVGIPTIKEFTQQINGLSEHIVRQLVLQNKLPHFITGQASVEKFSR